MGGNTLERENRDAKGFIINIYKYMKLSPVNFQALKQYFIENRTTPSADTPQRLNCFGNYDRISIESINHFEQYYKKSSKGYDWLGNKQSILLYRLDSEKPIFKETNGYFYIKDVNNCWNKISEKFNFEIVTFFM